MIIGIIIMLYIAFYLGYKLAMWAVRKRIKEVSDEVDSVYKLDEQKAANAFYDRIYNQFLD